MQHTAARLGSYRYGLVLLLAAALVAFGLTAPDRVGVRVAELGGAGVMLVAAVATSAAPVGTRRAAGIVLAVLVAVAATGVLVATPSAALPLGAAAVLAAATVVAITGGLARLVVERGVGVPAVLGAVAVYLLLGLVFAYLEGALATGLDGRYFAQGTDATQSERVYFSFTTLTTTGFGDLTAGAGGGRLLAVFEMLIGQLYLVTVIAMLVGNLRRRT